MNKPETLETESSFTLKRRAKILEILEADGQARVNMLSELFGVSEVTIRNDLDKLEKKGLIIKTRGGGIRNQRVKIDYDLNKATARHLKEKQLIGRKAASLVKDRDTVMLDSGTTTVEVAKNLTSFGDITVITSALNVAGQLIGNLGVSVVMLGGLLKDSTASVIGPIAEDNISKMYCDKIFLGVNGIDSAHGIYKARIEDAHLTKMMMQRSKEIIVVADSSKFLKRGFFLIAPIINTLTVVTDSNVPEKELQSLQNMGVRVIIADA